MVAKRFIFANVAIDYVQFMLFLAICAYLLSTLLQPRPVFVSRRNDVEHPRVFYFNLDHSISHRRKKLMVPKLQKFCMDFELMPAYDGKNYVAGAQIFPSIEESARIHLMAPITENPGQVGCMVSHFQIWSEGVRLNRPVIALESDTEPKRLWNVDPSLYHGFDIVYVHNYDVENWPPESPCYSSKCRSEPCVREGYLSHTTGAMLYMPTNWNKIFQWFLKHGISDPVDVQIKRMADEKVVKVGVLCTGQYPYFLQHSTLGSIIPGNMQVWGKPYKPF